MSMTTYQRLSSHHLHRIQTTARIPTTSSKSLNLTCTRGITYSTSRTSSIRCSINRNGNIISNNIINQNSDNCITINNIVKINKRFIRLPSYHPKYKKPAWVYDLDLDRTQYRGIWWLLPVPPKARPACMVFTVMLSMEYCCFTIYNHMMLAE